MKHTKTKAWVLLASAAGVAHAGTFYSDSSGDLFDNSFSHLDILSVNLSNDKNFLYVDIQLGGNLDATNWGKYALGIDTGVNAGDNSNPWNRNINWGRGITHWVGTWADDAGTGVGGQVWSFDGTNWNLDASVNGDDSQHAAGRQRFAISLADLGVGVGDTIEFDLISTGGLDGDPGVDHLSRSGLSTTFWDTQSGSGQFLSYAIVPLPPAAWAGLAVLGGIAGVRAVRRR